MPTENRRVATYLPKELDDRLKAFIAERNLKGDSPALIVILSEFFGVSQEVAHQGSSDLIQRIEALENRFSELKSELLSELDSKLLNSIGSIERAKDEVEARLLSELKSELPKTNDIPGQLNLIPDEDQIEIPDRRSDELPGELKSDLQASDALSGQWMTTKEAWAHLGKPGSYETFRKHSGERLKELYGVEFSSQRKEEKQYGKRWLKLSVVQDLSIESTPQPRSGRSAAERVDGQ